MKEEKFGVDPSVIMKVLVENKELGLAIVQIPLTLLNNWLGSEKREVRWEEKSTVAGYYWVKNLSDEVTVVFIGPNNLSYYRQPQFIGYKFAGPIIPPK